jgi:hypothetical protein
MADSTILEAALSYARLGWPVFPVGQDKAPLTRHGFQDASCHAGIIREWWSQYPQANVALGIPEGLVVLDFDPRNGAPDPDNFRWGDPYPLRAETPSGGSHLYFRVDPEVVLAGKWMQGVDVKAGGKGYVLLPPSANAEGRLYTWQVVSPTDWPAGDFNYWMTELPAWVLSSIRKAEPVFEMRADGDDNLAQPTFPWELGTPYGEYGLQQQLGFLTMAQNGERNVRLNRVGFRVGQLVAGGELKENALFQVARVAEWLGLEREEVGQTLRSSYEAGLQKPWKR